MSSLRVFTTNQNPSDVILLLRATIKDARDVHESTHESQSGHKPGLPRQNMWCTRLSIQNESSHHLLVGHTHPGVHQLVAHTHPGVHSEALGVPGYHTPLMFLDTDIIHKYLSWWWCLAWARLHMYSYQNLTYINILVGGGAWHGLVCTCILIKI